MNGAAASLRIRWFTHLASIERLTRHKLTELTVNNCNCSREHLFFCLLFLAPFSLCFDTDTSFIFSSILSTLAKDPRFSIRRSVPSDTGAWPNGWRPYARRSHGPNGRTDGRADGPRSYGPKTLRSSRRFRYGWTTPRIPHGGGPSPGSSRRTRIQWPWVGGAWRTGDGWTDWRSRCTGLQWPSSGSTRSCSWCSPKR